MKENADYEVFKTLIEEYHKHGLGVRAIKVCASYLVNSWAARQFRLESGTTGRGKRSVRIFEMTSSCAGLSQRLPAI